MSEKMNPAVSIMLDKERHLLLTLGGMLAFKKETGKDLFDANVTKALEKKIDMEDVVVLVWACLIHEDREITVEDVSYLIHIGNVNEVVEVLAEVFALAMPESEGKEVPLVRKTRKRQRG